LKRKTDYLCEQANRQLSAKADNIEDYYELVSLAQRLSSVSLLLNDQAKQTDQPGLMLASENAACLSTRLREKADQLRALCENAKNWEGDIKRAGENLRRRLETANQKPVKALEISPLNVSRLSPVPSEYCSSEIQVIKDKLQSFKFDDNGEPGLLRQQLQDYNKLRDQLKAAVQSEKLSRQISEVTARTKPPTASYTTINDFDKKIEPLLIITPQPTLNSQKSSTSLTPKIDHYNRQMALESHSLPGGALIRPSKANLSKAKISEEESNAARIAKIRDLRDVLSLLTFDRQFHQIADDCSQALDECEKVLVTLQETPNLADQVELNEQLNLRMEDIYPDIEKTDDMTSTALQKAPTHQAHTAASRVSSLLYDRWETVRVRLATRQNLLEIQILEDEQYKRMVEGYKSEQASPI